MASSEKAKARYRRKREEAGLPYREGQRGRPKKNPEERAKRKPSFSIAFDPEVYSRIYDAGGYSFVRSAVMEKLEKVESGS